MVLEEKAGSNPSSSYFKRPPTATKGWVVFVYRSRVSVAYLGGEVRPEALHYHLLHLRGVQVVEGLVQRDQLVDVHPERKRVDLRDTKPTAE